MGVRGLSGNGHQGVAVGVEIGKDMKSTLQQSSIMEREQPLEPVATGGQTEDVAKAPRRPVEDRAGPRVVVGGSKDVVEGAYLSRVAFGAGFARDRVVSMALPC